MDTHTFLIVLTLPRLSDFSSVGIQRGNHDIKLHCGEGKTADNGGIYSEFWLNCLTVDTMLTHTLGSDMCI